MRCIAVVFAALGTLFLVVACLVEDRAMGEQMFDTGLAFAIFSSIISHERRIRQLKGGEE